MYSPQPYNSEMPLAEELSSAEEIDNAEVTIGCSSPPREGWTSFQFNVKNFKDLPTTKNHYVETPGFSCNGHGWDLEFYPGGADVAPEGYASLYLSHGSEGNITATFALSIIDKFGKQKKARQITNSFIGDARWSGWHDFILRSDILDESQNILDSDGTLTVAVSIKQESTADDEVCACCGVAAVDDVKLKDCDDCDLVKYCSDNCQGNHREQHEAACKKRKAELHNKHLFQQPDISHRGECPLCCLPLFLERYGKSALMGCCCKIICHGCSYANMKREREAGLQHRCAFCREPTEKSEEKWNKNIVERVKKNDKVAMTHMGKKYYHERDYGKAVEYLTKAAELGDVAAHGCLGGLYYNGDGVEKDTKKAVYHFEQAAIGGHPYARYKLAAHETNNGRFKRAVRHLIMGANLGEERSPNAVKELFVQGKASKEDYAAALRGYQAAINETKSAGREKAEEAKTDGGLFVFD